MLRCVRVKWLGQERGLQVGVVEGDGLSPVAANPDMSTIAAPGQSSAQCAARA